MKYLELDIVLEDQTKLEYEKYTTENNDDDENVDDDIPFDFNSRVISCRPEFSCK